MSLSRKRVIDLSETEAAPSSGTEQRLNPWTGKRYSTRYHTILETRTKLPVYQFREQLLDEIQQHQVVVVEGETGSGTFPLCTTKLGCCFDYPSSYCLATFSFA